LYPNHVLGLEWGGQGEWKYVAETIPIELLWKIQLRANHDLFVRTLEIPHSIGKGPVLDDWL
jgi:hypothetical protein